MEIILKQDMKNLGYKNDVVVVRPGYGRNYLLPRGYAVVANETNRKVLAETKKQQAHKEEKLRTAAEKIATALKDMTVKVTAKVGESGKIFGSVTSLQLADAIKKLGYDVDRKNITISNEESVKTVGKYNADIRLHKEVSSKITFEVVAE